MAVIISYLLIVSNSLIRDGRLVLFSQMNNFGNIVFPLHKIPVCEIAVTFPKPDNAKKCDILSLHKSTALRSNIPCPNIRGYLFVSQ